MRFMLAAVFLVAAATAHAQSADAAPCTFGGHASANFLPLTKPGLPVLLSVKTTFEQRLADGSSVTGWSRTREARNAEGTIRHEQVRNCVRDKDGTLHALVFVDVLNRPGRTSEYWMVGQWGDTVAYVLPAPHKHSQEEIAAAQQRLEQAKLQQPSAKEFVREDLGVRNVLGVSAEGVRTTRTIPVGEEGNTQEVKIVTESWHSRDLGIELKNIVDDPRSGGLTYEVEELSLMEPDAALFAPPEGYTVKETPIPE